MTDEEAQKVLDELHSVRPEILNNEAKRLFEAIMKIADERDLLKEQLEKQSKIIDLMSEELATDYHSKEWVKKYFEEEAGEWHGRIIKRN